MQFRRSHAWMPSRREVMTAGASAFALTTVSDFARPVANARGTVFEGGSGAGPRRPGERGLPGVLISNGRDVVRTDPDGRWSLPVSEGDSVFVIKPPNWSTPLGACALPSFSCLHQPRGSPAHLRYAGVAPTGALPVSIDFSLIRQEESPTFEAILISDTQPENETELAYLRDDILVGMIGSGAAFAINHGDVVADDLSLYPRYLELLRATSLKWHHCPGNHDLNLDAVGNGQARDTWKRTFGPPYYAFQHGQATFIVLDNVHYSGRSPYAPEGGCYAGRIGSAQLQFVRNLLAHVPPDHLIVVSMHIPLVANQGDTAPGDYTADRRALLALLSHRPHTLSLSGHMHTTEHHYLGPESGFAGSRPHHHHVLTAASGSWWCGPRDRRGIPSADSVDGTPNGFHVLSVDGNHYTTRFVPAAGKGPAQIRVVVTSRCSNGGAAARTSEARPPIAASRLRDCAVVANVFDGGPNTRVTCDVAGWGPHAMQRVAERDPFLLQVLSRQDAVRKPWVEPVPSTHLWSAPFPARLPAGAHRLTVTAIDEYGRRHIGHAVIEVAAG